MHSSRETPEHGTRAASLWILASPAFVAAVLTLLANDLVLKRLAPGVLTGKLSDFAGLFAFAVFGSALFPARRLAVHLGTGLAFLVWKTPLVQAPIETWNALVPFPLGRTVDLTDWLALAVLPLSYRYSRDWRGRRPSPRLLAASIALASLAFVGTSYRTRAEYGQDFAFAGTPEQFAEALRQRKVKVSVSTLPSEELPGRYDLSIPAELCFNTIDASLDVEEAGAQTRVRLLELVHRCPKKGDDKAQLFRVFEEQVVKPLQLKPFPSLP